ncbi:Holliday junction resolvase RuvX [Megalodesulfovibrio paquesii]
MKHLGIDYGTERVGLAISDPDARLVFPFKTLYNRSQQQVADEIAALVIEHGVEQVVVGLPLHPPDAEGQEPLSLRQARNFVKRLTRRLAVPVTTVDETLTSCAARDDLADLPHMNGRDRRKVLDQHAAAHLLQRHLDSLGRTPAPSPPARDEIA